MFGIRFIIIKQLQPSYIVNDSYCYVCDFMMWLSINVIYCLNVVMFDTRFIE